MRRIARSSRNVRLTSRPICDTSAWKPHGGPWPRSRTGLTAKRRRSAQDPNSDARTRFAQLVKAIRDQIPQERLNLFQARRKRLRQIYVGIGGWTFAPWR